MCSYDSDKSNELGYSYCTIDSCNGVAKNIENPYCLLAEEQYDKIMFEKEYSIF